jgi:DNA polymerase-3 subunit delta'
LIKVQEDHKSILIDQIREMQKEISYKPYESNYKVYIIEKAAKMTIQAQNSLLKTLEEPPEYAIIILTNENKNDLIPTIVSRCQEVKLHNQSIEIVRDFLIDNKGFKKDDAALYATLSRGKYKKAVKLASKEDFIENRNNIIKFISQIECKNNFDIYNIAEDLINLSDTDFPLFELLLSYFRDVLVLKKNGDNEIINFDFKDLIDKSVEKFTTEEIYVITNLINKYRDYNYRNIKKDLLFPSLLFKIRNKKEL